MDEDWKNDERGWLSQGWSDGTGFTNVGQLVLRQLSIKCAFTDIQEISHLATMTVVFFQQSGNMLCLYYLD